MNLFSRWKDKVAQYMDVRLNLAKLAFIERTSHVLSHLIFTFIFLFLGVAVLLFLGLGLQEAFSVWLNSRIAGTFMAAAFFVVLGIIIFLARKPVLKLFAGLFIQILTNQDNDDDDKKMSETAKPGNEDAD